MSLVMGVKKQLFTKLSDLGEPNIEQELNKQEHCATGRIPPGREIMKGSEA